MQIPLRILVQDSDSAVVWNTVDVFWQSADFNFNSDLGSGSGGNFSSDTFKDESITFKQVLKDLSDPAKLFTDYSRAFSVPASKTNNKLFKHYYNIDIVEGVDARTLIPCKIEMNGNVYRYGNLQIEGVKMSGGVPRVYNLRFIGKLSELQKRIGEDKLTDLQYGSISSWNWKTQFTDTSDRDVILPLSSREKRFTYNDVNNNLNIENSKNIAFFSSTFAENYAIEENDLVPAMKVGNIIDTIESTYGLNFTGAINEDYIRDLYLYMHKVDKRSDSDPRFVGYANSYNRSPIPPNTNAVNNVSYISITSSSTRTYQVRAKAVLTGDEEFVLKHEGVEVFRTNASNSFSAFMPLNSGDITAEVSSTVAGTSDVTIEIEEYIGVTSQGVDTFTDTITIATGTDFEPNVYMPAEKIMDFISSIVKLFNLVLVVDNDLNVSTYHYDAYLSTGNVIDVTKYVMLESYDVQRPNLFNSMSFNPQKSEIAMNYGYRKVNGKEFGSLEYVLTNEDGEKLSGEQYKQDMLVNFIPAERFRNINDNDLLDYGYTYFASVKGEEQDTKFCFTYVEAIDTTSSGDSISYYDGVSITEETTFFVPVQSYNHKVGLHFGSEQYEYDFSYNHVGIGLWSLFYRGITAQMFDENKRNVSLNAYLSAGRLEKLNLNDTLIISNRYYQINSIDTNHGSGRTKLELTMVGQAKQQEFVESTTNVSNDSNTDDLAVVYIDSNGYVAKTIINTSSNSNITHIGSIRNFSHEDYTLS